jgi:hypothetical protein
VARARAGGGHGQSVLRAGGSAACVYLPEAAQPRVLLVWQGEMLIGALPIATRRTRGLAMCVES